MNKITLKLPGFPDSDPPITNVPYMRPELSAGTLGSLISEFIGIGIILSAVFLVFWFSWGVFQYIFAHGDKNGLQKARQRIIWAIIGFVFVVIAFTVSEYVRGIFPVSQPNLTPISPP